MEKLIIRVDAGSKIGTGHFMRCLALAQGWKDSGGDVTFIIACRIESLLERIREEGFDVHLLPNAYPHSDDWENSRKVFADFPGAWVVLDGYHFDETYQKQIKTDGHPLLLIDDAAHLKHYYTDILLNQNLGAEQLHYSHEKYTKLLMGSRYALLRREFLAVKDWKRKIPGAARKVLVTLGGSDPDNYTSKVIQALRNVDVKGLEAVVVVGAGNPHRKELESAVCDSKISIRFASDPPDIVNLMIWADLAVSSSGSTVWELLFLQTPALLLVTADNQRIVAENVMNCGVARSLGLADKISVLSLTGEIDSILKDSSWRKVTAENARGFVDGGGVQRVITAMNMPGVGELKLKKVKRPDCQLLWDWANDPLTRKNSFSPEYIPWENHLHWFEKKHYDTNCYQYILVNQYGMPIGQVRFDASGNEADISVSIAPEFRGHSFGVKGIKLASKYLLKHTSIKTIHAYIKRDNKASIRAFAEAGYQNTGMRTVKGHEALEMVFSDNEGD